MTSGRPLRVIRVLPELDFGGVESRVELQSRLHSRDQYSLRVCAFHKDGAAASRIRDLNVPVDILDTSPAARNPRATLALARYLRKMRPDVVHASIAEANFHTAIAARLAGVPVSIAEETGMPQHSWKAIAAYAALYRLVDAVVGVTQAVCDYVTHVDRAPAHKVRLIYNCARPDFFPEERRSVPATPPAEPFTFVAIGRLSPVKNHATLLRAFAQVVKETPDVRLRIIGDGPLREQTAALIRSLELDGHAKLEGYAADITGILASAGAFVLPSLSEGCSISLIEAMASGVPSLGSDVPGIREVLGPLAASSTCASGDVASWVRLMREVASRSPSERQRLGLAVQERAYELFSPSTYLGNVNALYRQLTASPA